MTAELLKLAGSIAAILFIAWLARYWQLGGDVRIRSEAQAREIADDTLPGFDPVDIAIDKAGIAALLRDADGRHLWSADMAYNGPDGCLTVIMRAV